MAFIDPNNFELVALDTARQMMLAFAVEHTYEEIEEVNAIKIKKKKNYSELPLYLWSEDLLKNFVEVICAGYVSSLQDQAEQAQIALRKVTIVPPVGAERFPSFTTNSDLP